MLGGGVVNEGRGVAGVVIWGGVIGGAIGGAITEGAGAGIICVGAAGEQQLDGAGAAMA